jgi:hypothetical protein
MLTLSQLFTDKDFCSIAMSKFLLVHADEEWKDIRDSHCSNGFVAAPKKQNGFSSGGAHDKRQPKVDAGRWATGMEMAKGLLDQLDHTRIVNTDETMWRLYPLGHDLGEEEQQSPCCKHETATIQAST